MEKPVVGIPSNPNFVRTNRHWVTIKRHLPVIFKPFVVGIAAALFWRFVIYRFNFHFGKEDENALLFVVLALSVFVYAIFAGYAVGTVLGDYKEISKAVVKDDMETFLLYRDEQLPILIHLLVGTSSVFVLIATLVFPYNGILIGMVSNFMVHFLLTLIYIIVIELDDYYHSIWFKEKVPKHWYEVDIEKYFKEKSALTAQSSPS